jgi:Uma2 family endonuclease
MTIAADQKQWTDAEFMALPSGHRYELVAGELVDMRNFGVEHGNIIQNSKFYAHCPADS